MREQDVSQPILNGEMSDLRQRLLHYKRGAPASLRRYFAGALHDIGKSQGIEAARSFVQDHTGEAANGHSNGSSNGIGELRGAALYANGNGSAEHHSLPNDQQVTTTTTTKP